MAVSLFTPLDLGGITLPNRIVISPMCQYSADDGSLTDWHLVHLGHLSYSGAGLMILEATHVTREGRITHHCAGLYNEHNEAAMKKVIDACRRLSKNPIGVQLGHAGRKASSQVPWEGREWLRRRSVALADRGAVGDRLRRGLACARMNSISTTEDPGWSMPSRLPPSARSASASTWSSCTRRTATCCTSSGPRSATSAAMPTEKTGMKFPLEVARAMREVWPRERALGARISANDWMPGGLGPDDAVTYARELERIGFDYVCPSSGALVPQARIPVAPGYQVPFAEKIKQAARIKVQTVGMIAEPRQAQEILASGKADMVVMARAFLDNPRWVWHAAEKFGVSDRLSAAVRAQPARPLAGSKAGQTVHVINQGECAYRAK